MLPKRAATEEAIVLLKQDPWRAVVDWAESPDLSPRLHTPPQSHQLAQKFFSGVIEPIYSGVVALSPLSVEDVSAWYRARSHAVMYYGFLDQAFALVGLAAKNNIPGLEKNCSDIQMYYQMVYECAYTGSFAEFSNMSPVTRLTATLTQFHGTQAHVVLKTVVPRI